MKKILKKQKISKNNKLVLYLKIFIFFVPILIFGCKDVNKRRSDEAQKKMDSTMEILEQDREIIEKQRKKIEDLEESWRIRDSVDGFSTGLLKYEVRFYCALLS